MPATSKTCQPQIRAQAKRALAAEQRRAQEDADRSARRSGQSSVDRTPIAIKRPKREGEWGVFSYAPDRPPGGAAPRKAQGRTSGGRPAASGFGSTEKVQERLGSSELVDRMRKERARATEASRARAAAAAGGGGGMDGGGENHRTSQEDTIGYKLSEPNGTAYQARELHRGDVGDGVRGGRGVAQQHRPSPPAEQRDGITVGGGRGEGGRGGVGDGGGGHGGKLGAAERYQGGRHGQPPSSKIHRPANAGAGEAVHTMYEERLANLERRLAGAGEQSHRPQQQQPKDSSRQPPLAGGGEEWGAENNPFGYRNMSAGEGEGGYGSMPSSTSGRKGLSLRGSEASGGEDVEGLSTMYMGPIAHKMAELRAGNG